MRHQAQALQVAEEVAAEDALRQRRLAGADGQVHLARAHQLLGDLVAGVAAADDDHRTVGQLRRAGGSSVLCSCVTSGARPEAIGGVNGTWNGPVATTTCSAR